VKSFRTAKLRLSPVLSGSERAGLARRLASGVLAAAGALPRNVVCDDTEVAEWAAAAGARVIWTPGLGLSGAVQAGVAVLGQRGKSKWSWWPTPTWACPAGLDSIGSEGCVSLVPDLRHDGTNVAAMPAGAGFSFSYGPGSFERHRRRRARLGLSCLIVRDRRLAADVDLPEDLQLLHDFAAPVC